MKIQTSSAVLISLSLLCLGLSSAHAADGGIGNGNTAEGRGALESLTTGTQNTAIGHDALFANTVGNANTASGFQALAANTTGDRNTASGHHTLHANTIGNDNTAIGQQALFSNTSGNNNTASGQFALRYNTEGNGNVANGFQALAANTTGNSNTATGFQALYRNTTGGENVANGPIALKNNTTGRQNTAAGWAALRDLKTGRFNVAVGSHALAGLTSGENNIALGWASGQSITGDNNIDIGNAGIGGESSTIRIGSGAQVRTFITGISGSVVTGTTVEVNAEGQLGVSPSSRRFKEDIRPMDKASEVLYSLQPVTYHYKKQVEPTGGSQFGLVAEDVAKLNPDLVVHDQEGEPYSVRYEQVNAMLLNEFLKEHKRVQQLEARDSERQKQIETLTNQLKEQAAQIQRVTAAAKISNFSAELLVGSQ